MNVYSIDSIAAKPTADDYRDLIGLLMAVDLAAEGDSNDTEIEALQEALSQATIMLGIESSDDETGCQCSDPFTASLTGHGHGCPEYSE